MSGIGAPGGAKAGGGSGAPGRPGLGNPGLPGGSDPSMEDILASIRRILSEDESAGGRPVEPVRHEPPTEPTTGSAPPEVFNLDASMMVDEPATPERSRPEAARPEPIRPEPIRPEPIRPEPIRPEPTRPEPLNSEPVRSEPPRREPPKLEPLRPETLLATPPEPAPPAMPTQQLAISPQLGPNAGPDALVAPAAAAAAAMSIGSLRRTLDAERQPSARGSGITVEEMVREELRPMLKTWLDENLAPIVERLVRAEIERVVGRSNS